MDEQAAAEVLAAARAEQIALAAAELAYVQAHPTSDYRAPDALVYDADAVGHGNALVREMDAWEADHPSPSTLRNRNLRTRRQLAMIHSTPRSA